MRHILIVDDALDLGRLLKTALSLIDTTMPIVVVPSGEEALLEGSRYPLDLLVTDIRLPGISGVELVHKIRKYHPEVRIIVITGMSDEQIRRDVKDLGVDYFFTKPLSMPEFTEAARRCLQDDVSDAALEQLPADGAIQEQQANQQMGDVLSGLRNRLDAATVALLNERARVAAAAGVLPDAIQIEAVLSRLSAVAHANAGVADLLQEKDPESAVTFRGKAFDMVLAPVGDYALIAILQASSTNLRLALAFEETLVAQKELRRILRSMGLIDSVGEKPASLLEEVEQQAAEPDTAAAEVEVELAKLEMLLQSNEAADADAFWEKAAERSIAMDAQDPEVLTYDQAHRLGLAPDSDEQDK